MACSVLSRSPGRTNTCSKWSVPLRLVAGLVVLNLLSYFAFVAFLFPRFPHLLVIEIMIGLLEAAGMMVLVRLAGGNPLKAWQALAISLVGNLASYLIGEAIWGYEQPEMPF